MLSVNPLLLRDIPHIYRNTAFLFFDHLLMGTVQRGGATNQSVTNIPRFYAVLSQSGGQIPIHFLRADPGVGMQHVEHSCAAWYVGCL